MQVWGCTGARDIFETTCSFSYRFKGESKNPGIAPGPQDRNPRTPLGGLKGRSQSTWVKPGRLGSFFVLCFLALGRHCLQMLCFPGFGTHANTHNVPHFRAFPASNWEHSPPKCLFFKSNAELPNRPGFVLPQAKSRKLSLPKRFKGI